MALKDHRSEASSDAVEERPSICDLIRPGLLRAFPLPSKGGADEEKFRVLLDALARRAGGQT